MTIKNIIRTIMIVHFYFVSFTSKNYYQTIEKNIALEIPPVKISKYEYEKNMNEFVNNFKNINKFKPTKGDIENWKNDFIDRTYLLADLYSKGYNKRGDVVNTVNSMARVILTQDHGLVLNEIIDKKIYVSDEEVKESFNRGRKKITLEVLKFTDKVKFEEIFGKKREKISVLKFDSLVLNKYESFIELDSLTFVWPYSIIGDLGNEIYNSNVGDIIYSNNGQNDISIFCTRKIEQLEQKPYLEAKDELRKLLARRKQKQEYERFDKKIKLETILKIDERISKKFMELYDFEPFTIIDTTLKSQMILDQFEPIYYNVIASYQLNGEMHDITVEKLLFQYSFSIFLRELKDEFDLKQFLEDTVKEEYILILADSLGFEETDKFVLDKRNYLNKTVLGFYEYKDLNRLIEVTSKEVFAYYNEHQIDYKTAAIVDISVLTFNSKKNAFSGKKKLESVTSNINSLRGLLKQEKIKLDWDSKIYSLKILSEIFDLKIGDILSPIAEENNYIVVVMNDKDGEFIKPFNFVEKEIMEYLRNKKRKELRNNTIINAKKNFTVTLNKI